MSRLRMAVVGVGHLGKEHARILASLSDVELVGVSDVNFDQARSVAQRCGTRAFASHSEFYDLVDAACIVVPTTYHFPVAGEFLRRGLSVLVEKPIALDMEQANGLVDLSARHQAILQVGHIERFNPAFEQLLERKPEALFVSCERHGRFTGRSTDIGVVLDLMIHDLDLLLALVPSPVIEVRAVGTSVFGRHEDVAQAWLRFGNGCIATVSASRASLTASRRMNVWAVEGNVSIDFGERKVAFVQPSPDVRQRGLDPRHLDAGAMARLKDELFGKHLQVLELVCKQSDQLTRELQHFVDCVRTRSQPRANGAAGRDALVLASRIVDALRQHRWECQERGLAGPTQLPEARKQLFMPEEDQAAA